VKEKKTREKLRHGAVKRYQSRTEKQASLGRRREAQIVDIS
jgi:hypothetical protein